MAGDTILIKDISINGNDELTSGLNTATSDQLSKTLTDNTINALGIDASSRTIWINGQPYGNAYVNINEDNTVEAPIGAEIFNDFEHNIASGDYSHASGLNTIASGEAEYVVGKYNNNSEPHQFSVGIGTSDTDRKNAFEVNTDGTAHFTGDIVIDGLADSNSEKSDTVLENSIIVAGSGNGSGVMKGSGNSATGRKSLAVGISCKAGADATHAEGVNTETGGEHNLNDKTLEVNVTRGSGSHAEGGSTISQGVYSHAEGELTFAKGAGSHAEGNKTTALGLCSHAEGNNTTAEGFYSHSEGNNTTAKGYGSHAEGNNSKANGNYSHVSGSYNTSEGGNSSLQGYYLFDHGIDTKDSFIWLQYPGEAPYIQSDINNPSLANYGCGYIKIGEQYLIKPEQSTDDPRVGYYKVTGLYYVKGPKADLQWSQNITDDGSHEYYISSEDLNNIINESIEWDSESPNFLTPPFTIWRYQYDENSQDFVNDAEPPITVQGCGWLYDETYKENYKQRLKTLVEENVSEGVIKLNDMYNTYKQPNKVPTEFTNNNATIVGKYNKPQPDDIFEVGCGNIGSSLKITQSNAISVSSSGETTILKLNTGDITVGNANVNTLTSNMVTVGNANANTLVSNIVTVTSSDQSKSVQQQITQLPTSPEDGCQSIICKDGILIGYSQSKYMFLKIDDNGNIILGNRKPTEEQKTKDLSYLFV